MLKNEIKSLKQNKLNFFSIVSSTLRRFGIGDFDPNVDYYKKLGLKAGASEKEIKAAYYKLANTLHPDHNYGIFCIDLNLIRNKH
jgi:hypothetical protein